MQQPLRVLMVTTSHSKLGDRSPATGIWLEELAAPYYVFKDAGENITIASPDGGLIPIDPESENAEVITEGTKRFKADDKTVHLLSDSIPLAEIKSENFDLIFIVGGHGSMWDLVHSEPLIKLMEDFIIHDKPIGAVGSGVNALISLKNKDGTPFVKGKKLTAFSNDEVQMEGLTYSVPFLLESQLLTLGAFYSRSPDYKSHVVTDGNLVTGQNPLSSADTAKQLLSIAVTPLN